MLELSSNEFKKSSVGRSLKTIQQCKNMRTNGATLHSLKKLNKKGNFPSLAAMDWIVNSNAYENSKKVQTAVVERNQIDQLCEFVDINYNIKYIGDVDDVTSYNIFFTPKNSRVKKQKTSEENQI
ncbi:unnamed protein product [Cunninghamella echinulata]